MKQGEAGVLSKNATRIGEFHSSDLPLSRTLPSNRRPTRSPAPSRTTPSCFSCASVSEPAFPPTPPLRSRRIFRHGWEWQGGAGAKSAEWIALRRQLPSLRLHWAWPIIPLPAMAIVQKA